MRRRGTAAVLAALAMATGGVVLIGVAGEPAASGATSAEISATIQQRADEVYASFSGSQEENNAAGVVQAYKVNGAMDACMKAEGFPQWDWSRARNYARPTIGLLFTDFFKPPLSHDYSQGLVETVAGGVAEHELMTEEPAHDEEAAIDRCDARTPASSDDAPISAVKSTQRALAEAGRLRGEWWSMLEELDEKYRDIGYYACITSQDIPGLGRLAHQDDPIYKLNRMVPPAAEIPASPSDPGSPAWQRLLAAEDAWEKLDWACREPTYTAHIADVGAAVERFATERADRIAVARQGWVQIVEQAHALGYDGSDGPIPAASAG